MHSTDDGGGGFSSIVDYSPQNPIANSIRDLLSGAECARLAVGYLFVEGLSPVVGSLDSVSRIELLIGNVVHRFTDEQLRESGILPAPPSSLDEEFAAKFRDDRNRAATETALNLRGTIRALDHTKYNREVLISLANGIASGRLRVRVSTQHRLHAKVMLATYPDGHEHAPGRAIVGTSNFTMPAVSMEASASSNIDVMLTGSLNYERLTSWYDYHWSQAQDFQRDLFEVLGQAWPLDHS